MKDRNGNPLSVGDLATDIDPESLNYGKVGIVRQLSSSHKHAGKQMAQLNNIGAGDNLEKFEWGAWLDEDQIALVEARP